MGNMSLGSLTWGRGWDQGVRLSCRRDAASPTSTSPIPRSKTLGSGSWGLGFGVTGCRVKGIRVAFQREIRPEMFEGLILIGDAHVPSVSSLSSPPSLHLVGGGVQSKGAAWYSIPQKRFWGRDGVIRGT
eukprot:1461185-Rhodomonas_salina.2